MKMERRLTPWALLTALLLAFGIAPLYADDDDKEPAAEEAKEEEAKEEASEEEDAVAGAPIPAEKVDLIKKHLKKAVIVHGTIAELKIFKSSGHALLTFKEGDVAIFIRKENLAKDLPWFLDQRVGKKVYVAGQVKVFRDQLEVVIVGPDQIADSPDGFDLSKIPLPDSGKKTGSSTKKVTAIKGAIKPTKNDYPDLPLKLEESSVQTVAFYIKDTGMKVKDDPYSLPKDFTETTVAVVTATVKKAEGSGPMQVTFPKAEEDSKEVIQTIIDQLAEKYGKWPKDKVLTIDVDFDSRQFKDDPASLVIAALINSLVTGIELPSDLVISGDVESDGTTSADRGNVYPIVHNSQIIRSIAENTGEPVRYICTDMSTDDLNNLALDGEWEALSNVTVMLAPTLDDALKLLFPEPDGALDAALAGFAQAQEVIRKNGVSMVKNSHVQQRVMALGKAYPKSITAGYYAFFARGKVPRIYSLPYTHHMLKDMHTQLRFMQIAPPGDPKEKFREYATKLKEMRPKLDPELSKLHRALTSFESGASDSVVRPRDGRAKERQEEKLKESDEAVIAELDALETRIAGGDEEPADE